MHNYKAVIFDYGGVLMSYCKEVPAWTKFEEMYNIRKGDIQKTLFSIFKDHPELDRLLFQGHVTAEDIEEDFLPTYLERKIGVDLPRPFPVLNLWMGPGSKIPFNENMMRVVKNLKSRGMHTSILTNNYKMDKKGLKVRTPVDKKLFDLIVESTVEGKMKPDIEIYEIIQSRIPSSISPCECIFLDDNKDNIRAAQDFGWTAILVDPHNIDQSIIDLERLLKMDLSH
ncbi:bigr-1 [Pristionchus pacificus]|uniref:Uncharacterized protein n=1 Tax=Pristionchus pacificus TaxID=54126 RepID=A0A2A6CRL9_PRIPA|nr:bigr-1 [Pristionchus pacificus]|eukprot:PDM80707.1 hypothetical protein PRIPAC_35710 [Pristionchus pacificus]